MTRNHRSTFRCVRLAAAALALGIFTSAGIAGVSAQDASPAATPAVACVSPGLPPGTPTPPETGSPVAMEGMDMGTPAAEAQEDVTGTPADEATSAQAIAVLENYVACFNEGQASGDPGLYVALESTNWVASQGYATRYDRVAGEMSSPFKTAELLNAGGVMTWNDGRVSVDAQLLIGPYWYTHWRIFFAEEDGTWLYDEQANLPPTPDVDFVAVNGMNIAEVADEATGKSAPALTALSGSTDFTSSDALIFNISNALDIPYSVAVVQTPEGVDPTGLLDGSVSFDDLTIFGVANDIAPEGSGDLTLLHLPAGSYAFLAFSEESSDGALLVTPFTVTDAS